MPAEVWAALDGSGAPGLADLRVLESDVSVAAGPILLGVDTAGNRHVLIPMSGDDTCREDRQSHGVQIVARDLIDAQATRRFCDIQCLVPDLNELFATVADEMLEEIGSAREEALEVAVRVLQRWRELLRPEVSRRIGRQQLAGILAELIVLREVVERDPLRRIDCWVGPEGARHDFRRGLAALEVKATIAGEGRSVEIHGVEQLLEPTDGSLFLAVIRLERAADGPASVGRLRHEIAELGVPEHELLARLQQAGYVITEEEAYERVRFEVRDQRIFRVDHDFPRIIPASFTHGDVPAGISRLTYAIDIGDEPPVPLDPLAAESVYCHLAGEP